jgi:dipeptidyl aminopeptidase/acylaminoacyl peptidase
VNGARPRASRTGPAAERHPPVPARRPPAGLGGLSGLPNVSIAGVVAAVALAAIGALSFGLLGGPLPDLPIGGRGGAGDVPNRTPNATQVFTPDLPDKPHVRGTILFAKSGNIWAVTGDDAISRITNGGHEMFPTWSSDGKTIYYLDIREKKAIVPSEGSDSPYTLDYPVLSRMAADGSGAKEIQDGLYSWAGGRYEYFYGIWQPALSPDGRTFAIISDSPDPFTLDYTLQLLPAKGGAPTRLQLPEDYGMGHNDPAWSPDGAQIAFTYNHRDGALGRPRIALYTVKTGHQRFLTDFGFAQPSFSPDGHLLAAVRTTARGRDVVLLDAVTGAEVLRVTDDGHSFAPAWSPAGDQVAFLRANGMSIDLVVVTLGGAGRTLSTTAQEQLTSQSGLDGTSRPSWFIPASQLPSPAPATPASPRGVSPSPSASAGG